MEAEIRRLACERDNLAESCQKLQMELANRELPQFKDASVDSFPTEDDSR